MPATLVKPQKMTTELAELIRKSLGKLESARCRLRQIAGDTAQSFQFAPPNPCFQSLITPGGNSRFPTPVRRQASGHISSKE